MKRSIALVLFAFLFAALAQGQGNFEGTIVYKIAVAGENADQMAAYMPNSYQYTISGSNLRFKINGGMAAAMMGEFLVRGAEGKVYLLKREEQIAYEIDNDADNSSDTENPPVITKMDETATIAGYSCQKYKLATRSSDGSEEVQYMWVTKDIKVNRPKNKLKNGGDIFVEGIDGFPMKIEMNTNGMTMTMTVDEVTQKSIPASELAIPDGFEVKKFDPSMFMGR